MFIWHPIFLASVFGLLFTYRRNKTFAIMGLVGLVIQIYVICAWSWWWQGSAFGARMMIVCTPIFVMGLASLQDAIAKRWSWTPIYMIAGALIAWNFLLYVYYRFYLVYAEMTYPATWYDMTLGRIMFIINRL